MHLQKAFSYLGGKTGDCPVAEAVSRDILAIPFHPYLESETQQTIASLISEALGAP